MVHLVFLATRLAQPLASVKFQFTGADIPLKQSRWSILCSRWPDLYSHWPVLSFSLQGWRHTTEAAQMVHLVFQTTRLVLSKILQSCLGGLHHFFQQGLKRTTEHHMLKSHNQRWDQHAVTTWLLLIITLEMFTVFSQVKKQTQLFNQHTKTIIYNQTGTSCVTCSVNERMMRYAKMKSSSS